MTGPPHDANEHRPEAPSGPPAGRRPALAAALVLLMGLVAGLPSLWARDLWHDEEIRLTEGARQLLLWPGALLPRINGDVQLSAPPLPYWATALLWKAGAGAASARVLSVLCVVGILLACFAALKGRGGLGSATMAPAIALTTMLLFYEMRRGGAGPLWVLLLTCALLAGQRALSAGPARRGRWWLACYAGAGLAVLSVGVSAAALIGLVLAVYCLAARRRPGGSVAVHLIGLALLAGAFALWAAAVRQADADGGASWRPFVHDLACLWDSAREGDLPEALLSALAVLLPWVLILPVALACAVRRGDGLDADFGLLLIAWLGVLAVPAVLGGREDAPQYAIALVPPLAMLCAGALATGGLPSGQAGAAGGWPLRAALALVGLVSGAVLLAGLLHLAGISYWLVGKHHVCPVTDQPYSPYALAGILPFAAGSLLAIVAALRAPAGRPDRRAWLLIVAVFLLGIPADLFLTPFIDAFRSARPFAERVAERLGPGDALYLYRRDYDGMYNLYTGRLRIPVLKGRQDLLDRLARPGAFVIADEKYVKRVRAPFDLTDLRVAGGNVGSRYMLLLRGGPAGRAGPEPLPGLLGPGDLPVLPEARPGTEDV